MKSIARQPNADFKCAHCRSYVSASHFLSGVINRNHCPYCLWSRHLDLKKAGDRLSACKGKMKPIGLSLKRTPKRYNAEKGGEVMLVHQCQECGRLSANRIAADDDAQTLMTIFIQSMSLDPEARRQLEAQSIQLLAAADAELAANRLFGQAGSPEMQWTFA